MERKTQTRRRGQVAVALCVAVAAVSLLIAGLALWRSHEAHSAAQQALQAHQGNASMRATVEQLLSQTAQPVPFVPVPAPTEDGPTGPTTSQLTEVALQGLMGPGGQEVMTDGGVVVAANGQAIIAQAPGETAPAAPTPHKWDGPSAPAPAAGAIVPWDEAAGHYSRTITVQGEVVGTGRSPSGQPVYLNFQPYEPGSNAFHIAIFEEGFVNAPDGDPEAYYEGKTVRVTGEVSQYRDAPQIKVEGPGMIEVVE
ncbi:MAG: hypothetical protein AAFY08_11705 [Planctomycetota bacterium]